MHSVTDALKQGWGAGLSPEYVMFREGRGMRSTVHAYLLRPEAVEAFFVLWRLTGNVRYREYGWGVFQAIEKWCKVSDQQLQLRFFSSLLVSGSAVFCLLMGRQFELL